MGTIMQKARVSFKEKTILNDRLVIENKSFSGNTRNDEGVYFAFYDNAYAALYSSQSRFITKIKTNELEHLIKNGVICLMP
jgi:hypothetical protein